MEEMTSVDPLTEESGTGVEGIFSDEVASSAPSLPPFVLASTTDVPPPLTTTLITSVATTMKSNATKFNFQDLADDIVNVRYSDKFDIFRHLICS